MLRALPVAALLVAGRLGAQGGNQAPPPIPTVDSIVVEGSHRIGATQILAASGLVPHTKAGPRDIQHAVTALFSTGLFEDVQVVDRSDGTKVILAIIIKERPVLRGWDLVGPVKIPARTLREHIKLMVGLPIDRAAVARSRYQIDSVYKQAGYYGASVTVRQEITADTGVKLVYSVVEGNRVAIARVEIEGNHHFPATDLVSAIDSKPEGFWWFRKGAYDDQTLDRDVRERLPEWYGHRGFIDFQVIKDTLIPDSTSGKATVKISVEEGKQYQVGRLEIVGNKRFSSEELTQGFPFGTTGQAATGAALGGTFDRTAWEAATETVQNTYSNNGYINARVVAEQSRRLLPDSTPVLDLRWRIEEGAPAIVGMIRVIGNEVTHERVIREAIVILPGELFNRERLLRSYQNISNLGFFQQPMPIPDMIPLDDNTTMDITFRVEEKHTGNINFGASVGQGTGLGGFLGLEEPNLFGRGKRGRLQWQFGQNINDFNLSYSDPAIMESRISGTVSVYDSRQKYVIGDLGRRRQAGSSLQIGLPFLGSRYSRVFASYGIQKIRYDQGSADLQARFRCSPCSRSTFGLNFLRDTRVGLPFPIAGSMISTGVEQNGGFLGGDGDYQKIDVDTRWFAPLGSLGSKSGGFGGGVQFTLGLTAKSGFIFGDPASFFTELYSLGGVQYGIPLRGYSEFSITPHGYEPSASSSTASPDAFGKAYAAFTAEAGARISQSLYFNVFFDAGNVYRNVRAYDPTRLFRGAGVGVALVSPLGPLGLDLGYGFDKTDLLGHPAPGFQLHFRLGNIGQ